MKIKNCCPYVEPVVIWSMTPENYILGIICAKCGCMIRAENVRPSQKSGALKKLTFQWNGIVEQNKQNIRDEISKIVDTQK